LLAGRIAHFRFNSVIRQALFTAYRPTHTAAAKWIWRIFANELQPATSRRRRRGRPCRFASLQPARQMVSSLGSPAALPEHRPVRVHAMAEVHLRTCYENNFNFSLKIGLKSYSIN